MRKLFGVLAENICELKRSAEKFTGFFELLWRSEKSLSLLKLMSSINFSSKRLTENNPEKEQIGEILTWAQVGETHRVRHGIYQRKGVLISLLTDFGKINRCYPDFHGDTAETVFYTGAGRRGDQKLDAPNQSLFNAIETKHCVPFFNKLKIGQWQFLGFWRVTDGKYIYDETQKRMVWKFTLNKCG